MLHLEMEGSGVVDELDQLSDNFKGTVLALLELFLVFLDNFAANGDGGGAFFLHDKNDAGSE